MSFTGEYRAKLNSKNQVTLPSPLREALFSLDASGRLVLFSLQGEVFSTDTQQCLELFTEAEWRSRQAEVEALARETRNPSLVRLINRQAYALRLDPEGNGRMLLPQAYAVYFKPADEAIFIGNNRKIEIWSLAQHDRFVAAAEHRTALPEQVGRIFDF